MLLAARKRNGDNDDVDRCFQQDGNEEESKRKIAILFYDTVHHNGGNAKVDGLDDRDMYIDLVHDRIEVIETKIEIQVLKAVRNGPSRKGERWLKETTKYNLSVFKI